jgi:putative flippase GtrA
VRDVIAFAAAGALGFAVDAGVLLVAAPIAGPHLGRLVSFCAAVLTTWLVNRQLAFGGRTGRFPLWLEFTRYLGVCIGGGLVNLACYSALVLALDLSGLWLVAAVAAGSLAGMAVNYTLSKRHVFAQSVPPRG